MEGLAPLPNSQSSTGLAFNSAGRVGHVLHRLVSLLRPSLDGLDLRPTRKRLGGRGFGFGEDRFGFFDLVQLSSSLFPHIENGMLRSPAPQVCKLANGDCV